MSDFFLKPCSYISPLFLWLPALLSCYNYDKNSPVVSSYVKGRYYPMTVSVIFEPEPRQWGLRGDPYFWKYLKKNLSSTGLPFPTDKLESVIRTKHFRMTGQKLSMNSMAFCEAFAGGGMSSGMVSGWWWTETGIPLLCSRLEEANAASVAVPDHD